MMLITSVLVAAAQAQSLFYGHWVVHPYPCPVDGVVVPSISVTAPALQWQNTVCRVRSSYLVRDAWHIAVRCTDSARDIPIALQLRGDRLTTDWGGVRLELRRCPS